MANISIKEYTETRNNNIEEDYFHNSINNNTSDENVSFACEESSNPDRIGLIKDDEKQIAKKYRDGLEAPKYGPATTSKLTKSWKSKTKNSRDEIDDLIKLHVKAKMPEIKFGLSLDKEKLPRWELVNNSALGCKLVLTKLDKIRSDYSDQSVYTNCQVEIRRLENSSAYELYLRVDPSEWYKLKQGKNKDIISNVNDYVDRIKNESNKYGVSYGAPSSEGSNPPTCTKRKICDKCDFFVCDTHRIYTENEDWYAAIRCNKFPIIIINSKKHQNNKLWIVTEEAWEIFWDVASKLQHDLGLETSPFERAFINFGYWTSEASAERDIDFEDVHNHSNMVLTPEVIAACKTGPAHLRALQHSNKCPMDYRLDDAMKLLERIPEDQMDEDEEPSASDIDEHGATVEIRAKSTIIGHLLNGYHGKMNRIFYDVFM